MVPPTDIGAHAEYLREQLDAARVENDRVVAEKRARLRDEFAMAALPLAWAAELADLQHVNDDVTDRHVGDLPVAKRAYRMADALLWARDRT